MTRSPGDEHARVFVTDVHWLEDRAAGTVYHSTQQCRTNRHLLGAVLCTTTWDEVFPQARHARDGGIDRHYQSTRFESVDVGRRHEKQPVAGEADDFRIDALSARREHVAAVAHRQLEPYRFHHEPGHAR